MGALVWEKVVHQHQGWRLVSSMWLHAGVLHLVVNMSSLMFVGMRLEQQFGYGESSSSISERHNNLFTGSFNFALISTT
jgi:membrane associated rhomboid family serine protease